MAKKKKKVRKAQNGWQQPMNWDTQGNFINYLNNTQLRRQMNWGQMGDYVDYTNNPGQIDTGTTYQTIPQGGENPQGGANIGAYEGVARAVVDGVGNVIDTAGDLKRSFLMGAPSVINALLPENHNERQRANRISYNRDPYGAQQFNNMFQNGGSVNRALQILDGGERASLTERERRFYEFIASQPDNTRVRQPLEQNIAPQQPQWFPDNNDIYPRYIQIEDNQFKPWKGGTYQDTSDYNSGYYEGVYGDPQRTDLTVPLLEGYSEGKNHRNMLKNPPQRQNGGFVEGQEVELTEEEIKQLERQGYQLKYD